jgi:hypothetical protein
MTAVACVFASSLIALANSVQYTETTPGFGQKDVCSGSKTESQAYGENSSNASSEVAYVCWMDAYISGTWVLRSSDYTSTPGTVKVMSYTSIPTYGTPVRLRMNAQGVYGGQAISGYMNFH